MTVWTTTVVFRDGTVRTYDRTTGQTVAPGDIVVIADGHPTRAEH